MGIDSETDGKTSNPFVAGGLSACSAIPLDCSEAAFGTTFGQDECYLDGSDAGITEPVTFLRCELNQQLRIAATYCGPQPSINVYLNILIDWNHDGDWNDIDICGPGFCAYEWPWKNTLVSLRQGCNFMGFNMDAGSKPGPSWLRVSLTQDPVSDDYPWAGSERTGAFHGGETEDYPVVVEQEVPTKSSTWGHMKGHYR